MTLDLLRFKVFIEAGQPLREAQAVALIWLGSISNKLVGEPIIGEKLSVHAECGIPMTRKTLTRTMIIEEITQALNSLSYVHAFYEGGAAAFNRLDEWSDIDLYVIVDDNKATETFDVIERALMSLSRIIQKYDVPQTQWKNVSQAFYRLDNTSEYLIIDLAVLKTGAEEKFLDPSIHGKAVFYFKRNEKITIPRLDVQSFADRVHKRIERLKARFDMFNIFVQKEINRGNFIEAVDLYYNLTLSSLIEALRIKFNPLHYDFRTRYVYYEFPKTAIQELEQLYAIKNREDLQKKYVRATAWFAETITTINKEETEKQLLALHNP